ncbi:MAG: chemotaxis protein CheC [Gammaproteobacteria bacterium]|nr:chemotaxis protein CheC [Gammaproteobacteria bacterium]
MTVTSFTELQEDAILELVNMGIGKAAEALSQIIQDEVLLSVPNIEFVNHDNLIKYMKDIDSDEPSAVMQKFSGDFCGNALLIFPEKSGMSLVRQMLRDTVNSESISDLEEEALMEIGNIILNACFGQLGNLLSTDLDGALPDYMHSQVEDIVERIEQEIGTHHQALTMLLQVYFSLPNSKTKGFVMFTMDVESLATFKQKVDAYLENLFG